MVHLRIGKLIKNLLTILIYRVHSIWIYGVKNKESIV